MDPKTSHSSHSQTPPGKNSDQEKDGGIDPSGPRPGFGLLRFSAESPLHRQALADAWSSGVRTYDFGHESWEEKAKALEDAKSLAESATSPHALHIFLRIDVRTGVETEATSLASRLTNLSHLLSPSTSANYTVLLSDPEFKLSSFDDDHARLYSAITQELETLQSLTESGLISNYGIGSAGFTYPKEDPQYLSIEELLFQKKPGELRDAASDPRFTDLKWIELPYNLFESAAHLFPNQNLGEESVTALQAARAHGLSIAIRRPYDALTDTRLVRLANYPDHHRVDLDAAVQRTLEVALQAESELANADLGTSTTWAHRLRDQLRFVTDPEQWKEIRRRKISPDLAQLRNKIASKPTPNGADPSDSREERIQRYFDAMDALLLSVQLWCEKKAAERNERVRARIASAVPSLRIRSAAMKPLTLQDIALRVYRSTPGIDAILIGMRAPRYVVEALSAFSPSVPRLSEAEVESALYAAHEALHEENSL